ncbi:UDP-N-acetylmuramate:L-alanyl-gamma-D-glutamyl-meso-diaminopimelate ligase [Gilvimarinus sp. F26214L]|uniref:UDP-N-acetylmuramate:L-alanyl-gamma-D-glutamyl- meso-diaminopimelate ligase n=1 Tax=Gilvimarinus sp. DZF01 TaxID=3461371 RepID=UPI004045BED2
MHIHILGICGTFMGSLAQLAKAQGHRVTGADAHVYPPMSTQLEAAGIEIIEGYDPVQLDPAPDLVIVGNAMSRGNPAVEAVLDRGIPYVSGPEWLHDHVLPGKWVLAVSGTHGKTTTSSMLAWILEYAGMQPGYLIGGVPGNFEHSARLGESVFFVVEADEYDTAFFDKRSKFVHYAPRTLVINNLEFDHADIFPDLAAIQTQFHHLMRILPGNGLVLYPAGTESIEQVLERGCWSQRQALSIDGDDNTPWRATRLSADGSRFEVQFEGVSVGEVDWQQSGDHNIMNGLAAIAAARHVGVKPQVAIEALARFRGVKRRMELLGEPGGVRVFDDFAHHPTAIKTTLAGLRARVGSQKIIALIEPRSNTMRLGTHKANLARACEDADQVFWYQPPGMDWSLSDVVAQSSVPAEVVTDIDELIARTVAAADEGTQVVVMSNGAFGGIHPRLIAALEATT